VACGNNRASVSQFVARIGRCPIAARRPNLHNIIGRKAGSLPNYGYSSAMKDADFVWDKENLDSFIAKPDEGVRGANCVIVFDKGEARRIL
jgi:cytochrome c2